MRLENRKEAQWPSYSISSYVIQDLDTFFSIFVLQEVNFVYPGIHCLINWPKESKYICGFAHFVFVLLSLGETRGDWCGLHFKENEIYI